MVRNSRTRSRKLSRKRVVLKNQTAGSPAYRLHGNLGLLSQSSLEYSPVGLTTHESGFSDHIVSTSGGGRRRRSPRRSQRRGQRRGQRRSQRRSQRSQRRSQRRR